MKKWPIAFNLSFEQCMAGIGAISLVAGIVISAGVWLVRLDVAVEQNTEQISELKQEISGFRQDIREIDRLLRPQGGE